MIQALISTVAVIALLFIFGIWILWCVGEWQEQNYYLFWFDFIIGIIAQVAIWYKVMT